jgi:hypothetical protein
MIAGTHLCSRRHELCPCGHTGQGSERNETHSFLKVLELLKGGDERAVEEHSKRPAAAAWGNGLWGSVGAAGRSYD